MPRITRSPQAQAFADRHGSEFVEGLARGLRVIGALGGRPRPMTLSEVAAAIDLPRATVRRSLHTLATLGFAEADGRLFRLTPRVLTLAGAYLASANIPAVMQPIVERVSAEVNEACSAAVIEGDEIVFVARAAPTRILSVGLEIGYRLPAYATAVGRVLLGDLAEAALDRHLARVEPVRFTDRTLTDRTALKRAVTAARQQGYAVAEQEVERGFTSLAVPVPRADGRLGCAIHIGMHDGVGIDRALAEFLPVLRRAAAEARPMLI